MIDLSEKVRLKSGIPLVVDLDGTLLKTDMLLETLIVLLKKSPFYVFLLPLWLLKGKAFFKQQIAHRITLDVTCLPYHSDFLSFLVEERQAGRQLVLATASNIKFAEQIAKYLGFFTQVFASDGETNLSGSKKIQALQDRFGTKGFDYAGNAPVDLKIWVHANQSILVNTSNSLVKKAKNISFVSHVFNSQKNHMKAFIKEIRIHQWVKNILIFIPLFTAHKANNGLLFLNAIYAFIAFSLCASSIYLINDLLDLEADRHHPEKKYRPFAAGDLPIKLGIILVPIFLVNSILVAFLLPINFLIILLFYILTTITYSFYLKQIILVDVIVLAGLYTIRITAGAAAINVSLSQWLLGFSMFIFLSLALVKRFSELHAVRHQNKESTKGRGYFADDLEQLAILGVASGYISVMVFALYINSKEVTVLYNSPDILWLICPLLLYWIGRVWLLAHRGQVQEDPIVFAIKDRVSYFVGVLIATLMLLAL